ncbi:MAG TPA: DUF2244 domain-containing protein [Steroidobacteraceae bacterium]|nr:DUF2244 domain-containing protein [Steroidobacteraceae bacterium]
MFDAPNHIDLAPHCSLSVRGAVLFFGAVALATFGIAGIATFLGYWPVLPFAGAEMLLLAWALHSNMQRRHERESIDISDTEVVITYARGNPARVVFPRHWARVKIRRPNSPLHRSRLVIESHGRAYEVGKFLTEEERRQLAAALRLRIGGMNQSPALPAAGSPEQFS